VAGILNMLDGKAQLNTSNLRVLMNGVLEFHFTKNESDQYCSWSLRSIDAHRIVLRPLALKSKLRVIQWFIDVISFRHGIFQVISR